MKGIYFSWLFDFTFVCLSVYFISQTVPWLAKEFPISDIRVDVFFLGVSISILFLRVNNVLKRRLRRNLEATRKIIWVDHAQRSLDPETAVEPLSRDETFAFEDIHFSQRMFVQVETLAELEGGEGL